MIVYNSKIAKCFSFNDQPWAVTFGQITFFSCNESLVSDKWHKHEEEHRKQFKREGFFKFLYKYIKEFYSNKQKGMNSWHAYWNILYEIEARKAENV